MDNKELKIHANNIRKNILRMVHSAGSGHVGGALGIADILTYLYFVELRVNPKDPQMFDRDRFVLSAAHMVPALYATLSEAGFFSKEELNTLRQFGSRLQGHTVRDLSIGVETTGGSLGQGVGIACGMAQASKLDNHSWRTYCILGDGESNEGSVWESAMYGAKYCLDNLTFILDNNNIQLSGNGENIMPMSSHKEKWLAFNWNVLEINGHNFDEIAFAFKKAKDTKAKPTIIIAKTIPGKGVSFMENRWEWHGKVPSEFELEKALIDLNTYNGSL